MAGLPARGQAFAVQRNGVFANERLIPVFLAFFNKFEDNFSGCGDGFSKLFLVL
jgi:hypothetical protein